MDGKPIAPGMTLFIGVENNSFSADSFFKNEKIIQTIFVYRVCYSIKEGQAQSALSDLQAYEDQKEAYRKKIEQLNQKLEQLDVMSDDYLEQEQKCSDILNLMNTRMEQLTEKVKALVANSLKRDQELCQSVRKRLMSRRQNHVQTI